MSNANEKRSLPRHALHWLQTEIDFWLADNQIDAETAARLRALYVERPDATPTSARPDRRDGFGRFLVFATATLGALALGIALYFILSLTWENLGKSCKIGVLLGSLATVYLGGFAARFGKRPNFSAVLFFLGAFVFGLSVWQFAEIFRFEIELPTAYWLWGALAFGVAFFGDRAATHYLAVPLLVVWTIAAILLDRPTAFSPTFFFPELPNAALSLPIFAALGYRWGVRRNASDVQLLYALLGVFWAAFQYCVWLRSSGDVVFFNLFYLFFLAAFVYFVGSTLVADRFVASKLRFLSAAPFFVFLLIYSRYEFYKEGANWPAVYSIPANVGFFALCGAVALATFFAARRKRPELFAKGPARRALLVSPVGIATLMLLPFFLGPFTPSAPQLSTYWNFPSESLQEAVAIISAAWTNLLVLAVAGVAFLVGAFRSAPLYWFGVLYFLIWLTLRYFAFDLDDATLAACFFGAISVALFSAAFFLARLRARLDADSENARREPAFVAFLADALDAPTAAETSAAPQSDDAQDADATPDRFNACALAAVVVAQFAILVFIPFAASRPFVPVESFVVEAAVCRAYDRDAFEPFGRDRAPSYLSIEYPFACPALWPAGRQYAVLGVVPPVVDESRGLGTVYAVLRRDPETDSAWATRITSKRPTSLASDEVLLVGRRTSRRIRAAVKFPGVDEFPTVPQEFEEELKEAQALDRSTRDVRARVTIETAADGSARIADLEFLPRPQAPSTFPQPQDDATPKGVD